MRKDEMLQCLGALEKGIEMAELSREEMERSGVFSAEGNPVASGKAIMRAKECTGYARGVYDTLKMLGFGHEDMHKLGGMLD